MYKLAAHHVDWCTCQYNYETAFVDAGKGEIVSEHYCLLPCDLRSLKDLDAAFAKAGLDAK